MSEPAERPLERPGRALFRRPVERLDWLVIAPALVNLLWIFDIAPGGLAGWLLTALMYASVATYGTVRLVRWRRRRGRIAYR